MEKDVSSLAKLPAHLEQSQQEPDRIPPLTLASSAACVKTTPCQSISCIHMVFLWANLILVKSLVSRMNKDWKTQLKYGLIV